MNSGINLGIFDLIGVIMLVLASSSFVYLLILKNKSNSSQILLWFFLCLILSSIATILTNIGTIWDWAFAPLQDALLILGGVFLVRFAYKYPSNDQAKEARWIVAFFCILAFAALAYSFVTVVKVVSGSLAASNLANQLQPEVMLIDSSVPFDDAAALVRNLKTHNPNTKSIVITDTTQQRRSITWTGADYALLAFNYESQIGEIFQRTKEELLNMPDNSEAGFKVDPSTST